MDACKELGLETIRTTILPSYINRELAEIDENMVRNTLSPFENVIHIKRRKELYELQHPASMSFSKETAIKQNKSQRTIQRYTEIANSIDYNEFDPIGERVNTLTLAQVSFS